MCAESLMELKKKIPLVENTMCKGIGAGMNLIYLKTQEVPVAGDA